MCDADAGILTYVWVKGHENPFPDFNVYVRSNANFPFGPIVLMSPLVSTSVEIFML